MTRGFLGKVPELELTTEGESRSQNSVSCGVTQRIQNINHLVVRCGNKYTIGIISSRGRNSASFASRERSSSQEDEQLWLNLKTERQSQYKAWVAQPAGQDVSI